MSDITIWGPGGTAEGGSSACGCFLNGVGAPAPALGDDGDFYLDTLNSNLYGPKTLGDWGTPVSLIGPAGPQGIQGVTGAQGPQGIPGPKGVKGDTGLTGATGATGATGPAGADGADGSQIYSDVVDPISTDGAPGDYWLNKATSTLWGPKDALTNWVGTSLLLKGATGATGPAGADGTDSPIVDLHVGQQNITNNTTAIAVTGAAVDPTLHAAADFIQVTGIFDVVPHGYNNGVTQQTNQLTINRTGAYKISLWASYSNSTNNATVGFRFAVNGVISLSRTPKNKTTTAADYKILSAHGVHQFAAGDIITLWVASDVTTNITITDAVFSVQELIATGYDLEIEDEGVPIATTPVSLDFVGAGVTVTDTGSGNLQINIPGGGSTITVQDEGTPLTTAVTLFNFAGAGVTVTEPVADQVLVTIPGGGGGSIAVQEEGVTVSTSGTLNFVGAGATATDVGGVATVSIPGGISGVAVQEEGTSVVTSATMNFVGAGVTATNVGGTATVTVPGNPLEVKDEGVSLTTNALSIDFAGAGVTVTEPTPDNLLVTIPGGGGGGSQAGVASSLASGDYHLPYDLIYPWADLAVLPVVAGVIFGIIVIDSEITINSLTIDVTTSSAASTIDLAIYKFLGAGKPGAALAFGQGSGGTIAIVDILISPSVTLAPGVYFYAISASSSSIQCTGATSVTYGGAYETMLLRSDGIESLRSATEFVEVRVPDASLPGGSYTLGMNMTGLNLTASNAPSIAGRRLIFLRKA